MKMISNKLRILACTVLSIVLSGCGITYRYDNESFRSSDDALAAQHASLEEMLKEVKVRNTPIAAKALVLLPTKQTISALGITRTGTPREEIVSYVAEVSLRSYQLKGDALRKSKLFSEVETRTAEFPIREARKEQGNYDAVVYLHLVSPTQSGWYELRRGDQTPQLIVVDPLSKKVANIESWIDGVAAAYQRK